MAKFDDIKTRAENLVVSCAERDKMFRDLEDMYLLKDSNLPDKDWVRETICPDPRNELIGAQRLLSATDPEFRVPTEMSEMVKSQDNSNMELYAKAIFQASNRAQKKPMHMELALTALLYGEAAVAVRNTSAIKELANTESKSRLEFLSRKAPFLFTVISPTVSYPLFDEYGLAAHLIKQSKKVAEVRSLFGTSVEKLLKGKKDTDTVDFNEWWDETYHVVWVDGEKVIMDEHKLPFIPISCQIIEGSNLFMRSGQQSRQPFLYSTWKSGLWSATNLAYTYTYTKIAAMGMTAQNVFKTDDQTATAPEIDWTTPFGMAILRRGEELTPYQPNLLDPQLDAAIKLAEQKITESTVYRQALGEPLGANAPFSMVSLLSQSGRLPLVPYQRMCSDILANAMQMALYMAKEGKADIKAYADSGMVVIEPDNIPEIFEIDCVMDVSMPTDDRQNATIATQLLGAKLASKSTIQEKFLNIKQPDKEQEKIWYEDLSDAQHQLTMQAQLMQLQQQFQTQQAQTNQQIQTQGQAEQMALQQQMQMQAQQQPQSQEEAQMMAMQQQQGMPMMSGVPESLIPPEGQTGAMPGVPGMPLGSPVPPEQMGQ